MRTDRLLQIVTRAAGDIETRRHEHEVDRREGFATDRVELLAVQAHPYSEPSLPGGIVMGGSGGVPKHQGLIALSAMLRARNLSTETATKELFKLINRTPFNIAPEKAQALAAEVFRTQNWTVVPRGSQANFWARVDERAIYVTWSGLASLWCVAYVAYAVMQMGSVASRTSAAKDAAVIDFGREWHQLDLQSYVDFAKRLVR